MKKTSTQIILSTISIVFILLTVFPVMAQVPSFDSDKPLTNFESNCEQTFTTWDKLKFDNIWDVTAEPVYASNIVTGPNGYLKLPKEQRQIWSPINPYTFESQL